MQPELSNSQGTFKTYQIHDFPFEIKFINEVICELLGFNTICICLFNFYELEA